MSEVYKKNDTYTFEQLAERMMNLFDFLSTLVFDKQ